MKAVFRRALAVSAITAIIACCPPAAGLAAEGHTAGCAALAGQIGETLKLKMNQGREGANIVYTIAAAQAGGGLIRLSCPQHGTRPVLVTLSYPAEFPPRSFYDQLAAIGEIITGVAAPRVRLLAHRCHRAAMRAYGRAHKRSQVARIDCTRSAKSSVFWLSIEGRPPQLSRLPGRSPHAPARVMRA